MKYILMLPLVAIALAAPAIPGQRLPQTPATQSSGASQPNASGQNSGARKIPCKTPENAAMCYWTRGRLSFYNGTPPYRVWKIGTNRVLGIYSGPAAWPPHDQSDQMSPALPLNVQRTFHPPANRLFADFEVCPLEEERPGWMQHVCIESARSIFVEALQ